MIYAQVVVDHKTALTNVFTYSLNPDQLLKVKQGQLVEVPFRQALRRGIVIKLTKKPAVTKTYLKPIKRIISHDPIVTIKQLQLANWLASYYGVSLGEAVFTMIPPLSKTSL